MRLFQAPLYGFPNLWAHSLQSARMAEAFLANGVDTTLVYPWHPDALPWESVRDIYGLRQYPRRTQLKGSGAGSQWPFGRLSHEIVKASLAVFAISSNANDVFLGRQPGEDPVATLLWLKASHLMKARLFVELHEARHYLSTADSHIDGYVVISEALRGFLANVGINGDRIVVAPNAVSLEMYEQAHMLDPNQLRRDLGLPERHVVVCYTGQLYKSKNVELLIASMKYLSDETILVIVGGQTAFDLERIRAFVEAHQLSSRVRLVGQQRTDVTVRFQMAADVLAIPSSPDMSVSRWGSPLKLQEYLATGRPIAACLIPSLQNVLRDDEVVWAQEATAVSLAGAIRAAAGKQPRDFNEVRGRLGGWTWRDRASRIAEFMGLGKRL